MSIEIYIPSKGRPINIETLKWLPVEYLEKTFIVCPLEEQEEYIKANHLMNVLSPPLGVTGVAATRQWCIEGAKAEKIIFFDDDLHFQKRIVDSWKLLAATPDQMRELLAWMEKLLDEHPLVGLSSRQGNNRSFPEKLVMDTRTHTAYGVVPEVLKKENIRFDEIPLMEDFNVCLHLLRKGYHVPNIQEFCWGQKLSNADGGCSSYRTFQFQENAAKTLAYLHRDFVKPVLKKTPNWANGLKERVDVRVYWKQAWESSQPGYVGKQFPKRSTSPNKTPKKEVYQMNFQEKQLLKSIADMKQKLDRAATLVFNRDKEYVELLRESAINFNSEILNSELIFEKENEVA